MKTALSFVLALVSAATACCDSTRVQLTVGNLTSVKAGDATFEAQLYQPRYAKKARGK